jgi:hypothetical protein
VRTGYSRVLAGLLEVSTGYSRGTRGPVGGEHGGMRLVALPAPRIPDGTVAGSCLCWAVRSRAADRGSIRAATCLARPQQDVGTAGPPRNGGRGRRGHMAALPTPVGRITNGTQAGSGVSSLAMGGPTSATVWIVPYSGRTTSTQTLRRSTTARRRATHLRSQAALRSAAHSPTAEPSCSSAGAECILCSQELPSTADLHKAALSCLCAWRLCATSCSARIG